MVKMNYIVHFELELFEIKPFLGKEITVTIEVNK
jgi:hypothetical protein